MKSTLKTVQTIFKVGRIISKIAFICCVIGCVGCLLGAIGLVAGFESLKLGGITVRGLIVQGTGMSMGTMCTAVSVAAVFCGCEAVAAKMAETYFQNELAAGTPFTFEGANELKFLGILNLAISLGMIVFTAIVYAAVRLCGIYPPEGMNWEAGTGIRTGLFLLLLSVVFRYGAELSSQMKANISERQEQP